MKAMIAKAPKQELQKDKKTDMIPARLVWDHVDRLDGLNGALNELAVLVAVDNDGPPIPALLNLLRDHYQELSSSFCQSIKALKGIPSVH